MTNDVKCYVCSGDIDCYPADHPEHAICPSCCEKTEKPDGETTHAFEYDSSYRVHVCKYCGAFAPPDFYID